MMKRLLLIVVFLFLMGSRADALQTVRVDGQYRYWVTYYYTVFNNPVASDFSYTYVIIPGIRSSWDVSYTYHIAPQIYPISAGLPYQWTLNSRVGNFHFKKGNR